MPTAIAEILILEVSEKMKNVLPSALALLAVTLLASLMPANAVAVTGPLGGSASSVSGTSIAIDTATFVIDDGFGNVVTYVVESETLVKGASTGDVVTVTYYVLATCTSGTCPSFASIGSLTSADNNVNQSGGSCTLGTITPNTGTGNIPIDGATTVVILSGSATLDAFPPKGRNTVALLGYVTISVIGFSDVSPDFSIQWFKAK